MAKVSLMSNAVRFFLLFIILLIKLFVAHSQNNMRYNVKINKLSTLNGLPSDRITKIAQDKQGFIWIGTGGGLVRFDGLNVKTYTSNKYDSTQLPDNLIRSILVDKKGFLWIGTNSGIFKFDTKYEKFTSVKVSPKRPVVWHDLNASSMYIDKQNRLWANYQDLGMALIDCNTDSLLSMVEEDNNLNIRLYFQCEDSDGNIWFSDSKTGFYKVSVKNKKTRVEKISRIRNPNYRIPDRFTKVYEDKQNNLYFYNNGLFRVSYQNRKSLQFEFIDIFEGRQPRDDIDYFIVDIIQDNAGNIWIATDSHGIMKINPISKSVTQIHLSMVNYLGVTSKKARFAMDKQNQLWMQFENDVLLNYHQHSNTFEEYKYLFTNANSVCESYSTSTYSGIFFQDRANVYWLPTSGCGLNYFDLKRTKFSAIYSQPKNPNSLSGNNIWALTMDNHSLLWVGVQKIGLDIINTLTGQVSHFPATNPLYQDLERITSIEQISNDTFLLGCIGAKLCKINRATMRLEIIQNYQPDVHDPESIPSWIVLDVFQDYQKRIWIGTLGGGVAIYEPPTQMNKRGRFKQLKKEKIFPRFGFSSVWHIAEDALHRIWISSTEGMFCYTPETDKLVNYSFNPNDSNSISSNNTKCFLEDSKGRFWIATEGGGLNQFIESEKRFVRYDFFSGLPINRILSVFEDKSGYLWLSSSKGIIKFDPDSKQSTIFTLDHGIQSTEFTSGSFCQNKNDKSIYYGSLYGITYFNPDSVVSASYVPNIVFTRFKVFNEEIQCGKFYNDKVLLKKAISYTDTIRLDYKQNMFSIEFAALDFSGASSIKYAYRIMNISDKWLEINSSNTNVSFTNLAPDTYTLQVRSTNADGLWCENTRSMVIIILPPWWKTSWAYSVYVLLIIIALFLLRYIFNLKYSFQKQLSLERLNAEKSKLEFEKQKEIEQIKIRFFMNISHEFRTPLTLILGPLDIFMRAVDLPARLKSQVALIQRNANRLLRLVNQLLDMRKIETGNMSLHLQNGNIIEFLKANFDAFVYMAQRQKITYTFHEETNEVFHSNCYFDPDKIEKIMYNLLSNAFKYTPDNGSIQMFISFQKNNTHAADSFIQIRIKDSGIGIPTDKQAKIFERFYQAHSENVQVGSPRKQSGTGIGLSLTKELVELHGGTLMVESTENHGSTFTFSIPWKVPQNYELKLLNTIENQEDKYPHITKSTENDIVFDSFSENILTTADNQNLPILLLVDDNPDIRLFIVSELTTQYNVLEAENGFDGFNIAIQHIPDLIISDVMMPVMDGIEFCSKLKKDKRTSHIPVILLTARSSEEAQIEGLKSGATDYISKPFNMAALILKIDNIIEKRLSIIQKYSTNANTETNTLSTNPVDKAFLEKAELVITQNMKTLDFSPEDFASQMNMSYSQLYRKIKGLTNLSVNLFARMVKLKHATKLLQTGNHTISEVAYLTGFKSPNYFTQCFKEQFGISASNYLSKDSK